MADEEKIQETVQEDAAADAQEKKPAAKKAEKKPVRKRKAASAKKQAAAPRKDAPLVSEEVDAEASESSGSPDVSKLLAGVLVVAVLFAAFLLWQNSQLRGDGGATTTTTAQPRGGGGDKVKLDFYVMSQCPYGTQVMDAIAPVLKSMGDAVDFKVDYIGSEAAGGEFTSLHGQPEVDENIRQLCVMKHYPENYKYMSYITCRDKSIQSTNWEPCARDNGMDAAKIKACAQGSEGKGLLSASFKAASAAGARGSPTIKLAGAPYTGGRKEADFKRALCNAMTVKHSECANIPEPTRVDIVILNDKRCKDCDTAGLESSLKSVFAGAVFKYVDYGTPEGKSLYASTEEPLLPAILFDEKVKQDPGYASIERYLAVAGDTYGALKVGATFDPTAEICDNGIDDTGDGQVDCADATCSETMACRPELKKRIDLFVMSQCPYGIQALNSMKDVLSTFKDMSFNIHYIAGYDESTGTFNSLHGQAEVDDNIRELCAIKHYPDDYKYMDYIWCRNKAMSGDWTKCATDNGMDAAKLKACAEGDEGKGLLREDLKLAESLNIGASPTWLANNRVEFSGITADSVRQNYCANNPGLPGCEKVLSTDTGSVAAGGSC